MPDASPAKWHLAHTTWFFETFLLSEYLPGYETINPAFRNLFNSYYNAVGDRPLRTMRHVLSRPSLGDVHAYRAHVDAAMERLLSQDLSGEALDLVALGLNHEQQHQELIVTDVKYGLAANPLRPAYREESPTRETQAVLRRCGGRGFLAACIRWDSQARDFRSTTRVRSTRYTCAVPIGVAAGDQRRVYGVRARPRLLRRPRCGSLTDGTTCAPINGALRCTGRGGMKNGGNSR